MPKLAIENMNHGSATDHRILRDPSENLLTRDDVSQAPSDELVYDSKPLGFADAKPDLRSLALAYPQVAGHYPELRQKGFAALQKAAQGFPNDAEVQATYGLVLLVVRPGERESAGELLQRASISVPSLRRFALSWQIFGCSKGTSRQQSTCTNKRSKSSLFIHRLTLTSREPISCRTISRTLAKLSTAS
jgi:hypothetical protein